MRASRTVKVVPKTNQRFLHSRFNKEFVLMSDSGSNVHDFEDRTIRGSRQEPDGTVTDLADGKGALQKGRANTLQFTDAGLRGGKFSGVTPRGNNVQTTAPRRKFLHFDEGGN